MTNRKDIDDAPDTNDPGQHGVYCQGKDRLFVARGKERRREETAVIGNGTAILSREESATAREDAAHLREAAATSREREIHAAETIQAASDDHMMMLQHVNERLVITTIESQKLAEQLQATKAQLESAKSVAEKANLAKSEFLSSMSHELRSPLNAILGFAQLLEADTHTPLTPPQKESIGQILKAGWYLLDLINEILDLALIESGKLSLSHEPISLTDVMTDCQAMIETQAKKHDIHITFPCIEMPYFVYADRTRVKQVLLNLLSNAIKYNRIGGTVSVDCSVISQERIRISITDTGVGLSPEQLEQLFQSFNRLGQEDSAEEGTGIGLVVSKRLIELMGGTIGVKSTVGSGSVFWIELQLTVEPQHVFDTDALAAPVSAPLENNMRTRTLLYVEDNPANLMLVEQLIARRPDMRLLSASDAKLGITLARTQQPEIILMDINLPGISGVEALQLLREDPLTKHIPVIAISANAMPHDIRKGMESGFFRYLTKPIKVNEFMNTLDVALKHSETESAAIQR
ncbi:MAG TPA: ATP-binding protein [Gammaproteobacteria bacterium]|nr:ATP-binding protein [Gammaproteobacteria bacterium]